MTEYCSVIDSRKLTRTILILKEGGCWWVFLRWKDFSIS